MVDPGVPTTQQVIDAFTVAIQTLDTAMEPVKGAALEDVLVVGNPLWEAIQQNNEIIDRAAAKDDVALYFSQRLVQLLFKSASDLALQIYVVLLQKVCDASKREANEENIWLLYADDEVFFLDNVRQKTQA